MAARKGRGTRDHPWEQAVREKIQTSMLVNRLTAYVKGDCTLEAGQVTAALGLLRKTLPDLTSSEVTGKIDHRHVIRAPAISTSDAEWVEHNAPPKLLS